MATYSETDIISLFGFESKNFDDVAYLNHPKGAKLVLAADSATEGSHFRLDWNSPEDIAHKLFVSNLSDFRAGRARPVYAILSIGIDPGRVSLEWMARFAERLRTLTKRHDIVIAGGDTVRSKSLFFHITLAGYANKPTPMNSAQPGERIYLSRMVGWSALGYQLLKALDDSQLLPWPVGLWGLPEASSRAAAEILQGVKALVDRRLVDLTREEGHSSADGFARKEGLASSKKDVSLELGKKQAGPSWFGICRALGSFLFPHPPRPIPEQATSATDLSDGLSVDLERWARAADCGFSIDLEPLVTSQMWRGANVHDVSQYILHSGEEYALVYTTPEATPSQQGIPIGWVSAEPGVRYHIGKERISLVPGGFRHF